MSDLLTRLRALLPPWAAGGAPPAPDAIGSMLQQISDEQRATRDDVRRLEQELANLRTLALSQEKRLQRNLKEGFSSATNLSSIVPELGLKGVIPPFAHHAWEITGEMAVFLFHLVRRNRPKLIVELGSGSSTVLLAAALRANGAGHTISIEHDPEHRGRTEQYLRNAELSDWVSLIAAPLESQEFGPLAVQWYGISGLLKALTQTIDLVFVDGPPGRLQPLSRYPALPVLMPHLSPNAVVLLDDGRRDDETTMVELWRKLEISFDAEVLEFLPRSPVMLTMRSS